MSDHRVTPASPAEPSPPSDGRRRYVPDPIPLRQDPPAQVQRDLDMAQHVIDQLAQNQVNLHFEVDRDSGTVRVQLLDAGGHVFREIPARSLLDTLSGGGLLLDQTG